MHIRNQEKLAEFSQKHPNSKSALDRWLELMEREISDPLLSCVKHFRMLTRSE